MVILLDMVTYCIAPSIAAFAYSAWQLSLNLYGLTLKKNVTVESFFRNMKRLIYLQ